MKAMTGHCGTGRPPDGGPDGKQKDRPSWEDAAQDRPAGGFAPDRREPLRLRPGAGARLWRPRPLRRRPGLAGQWRRLESLSLTREDETMPAFLKKAAPLTALTLAAA